MVIYISRTEKSIVKNSCLYFSCFFIFLSACYNSNATEFSLKTPNGKVLLLEIARTVEQHQQGLMFRKKLAKNVGMLFIFPQEQELSFWMKNTSIPLSIAFIDASGVVINIEHMIPFSLETILSLKKAKYAIELNRGLFPLFGVYPGTKLALPK